MAPGTRAVVYQCILDGKWSRFYLCADHIESFLEEEEGHHADLTEETAVLIP